MEKRELVKEISNDSNGAHCIQGSRSNFGFLEKVMPIFDNDSGVNEYPFAKRTSYFTFLNICLRLFLCFRPNNTIY